MLQHGPHLVLSYIFEHGKLIFQMPFLLIPTIDWHKYPCKHGIPNYYTAPELLRNSTHMDRFSEWFVPKFGPRNFRLCCGILFLPYTGMVVSFAVWGSLVANFSVERLVAICVVYFLALGVSAHCLDAMGSKSKPWGFLSKKKIIIVSVASLSIACVIGLYYAFLDSPLLFPIGIAEVFFLFAYNLELFGGRFHNNLVFVISWGTLPVFAGSAIQTNTIL